MRGWIRGLSLALALIFALGLWGCGADTGAGALENDITQQGLMQGEQTDQQENDLPVPPGDPLVDMLPEDGYYYSAEEVAMFLVDYGRLPDNFITKDEARKLGWEGGSVEKYAPGMAIGGDTFGNREGLLPEEYSYIECDIDTDGATSRGAKRLVFSQGLEVIYYTEDHYEHFELMYGEE